MKIVYEKKYVLSPEEKCEMESFLSFLAQNPLPCQGCKAYEYGKCVSHSIWDDLDQEETCTAYRTWRDKAVGYRNKFKNLIDEDLMQIIENKYILNYTLQNVDKASAIYKIAQSKEIKTSNRIGIDYSYNLDPDFLFSQEEENDFNA